MSTFHGHWLPSSLVDALAAVEATHVDVAIARGVLDDHAPARARPTVAPTPTCSGRPTIPTSCVWRASATPLSAPPRRCSTAPADAGPGDEDLVIDRRRSLDRHWGKVRGHILHGPDRIKHIHLGRRVVEGVASPVGDPLI